MKYTLRILTALTVLIMPVFAADVHEAAKTGNLQKVQELVKADGITVYHPGDYGLLGGVEKITPIYSQDMHFLKENANKLDIMFMAGRMINGKVPEYINFSIETAEPRVFFPMHYQSSEYLFRELADEIAKAAYTTKIIAPENRGDMYLYKVGKIKTTAGCRVTRKTHSIVQENHLGATGSQE